MKYVLRLIHGDSPSEWSSLDVRRGAIPIEGRVLFLNDLRNLKTRGSSKFDDSFGQYSFYRVKRITHEVRRRRFFGLESIAIVSAVPEENYLDKPWDI